MTNEHSIYTLKFYQVSSSGLTYLTYIYTSYPAIMYPTLVDDILAYRCT